MIDSKLILMYFAIFVGAGDKLLVDSEGKMLKLTPEQVTKAQRGSRSRDLLLLEPGAGWGWWSMPRPGRLTSGDDPGSLYRRLGGSQGPSGRVRKICPHRDSISVPSSP
jgi:hypothetical protein